MNSPVLPTYARHPIAFERGEGVRMFSTDGEAYLDFGAGIAVNSLGHCHPHLVEILQSQAEKLWHTSNIFNIPDGERLAARLTAETFADTMFFTNSGAEALECAIKMARKYHSAKGAPERYRLITFDGAFHGRTLATIAAGGQEKHLAGFGPVVDGFDQVPFIDLKATEAAITDATAGILIEPIQGEGGIRPVSAADMKALRNICDRHGILLIFDEVQTGVGRTGRLFAHQWSAVTPDIMAIAKGIGGGFPLGACLATSDAAIGMTAGSHGSTFGGNPLAMAVGNGVLDVVLEAGFLDSVADKARNLKQKLARLSDDYADIISGVRGEGLMIGLECKVENTKLAKACLDNKLISVGAGDNILRLLPPLTITDDDIDDAVAALESACQSLR